MEQNRRSFLGKTLGTAMNTALVGSAALSLGLAGTSNSLANTLTNSPVKTTVESALEKHGFGITNPNEPRRVRMVNAHTKEKISVIYRNSDGYVNEALQQINFLLRDYRANEVMQIDTVTIDYLYQLYAAMKTDEYIQILSGYRSVATNEMLRKRLMTNNVAKKSLHIVGKAIDFRIPGSPIKDLQLAALDMKIGGIGYYPKSGFVHIDSGPFRHW